MPEEIITTTAQGELMDFNADTIIQKAAVAEKMLDALNKIMNAALKITTEKDWTIIGGVPYLQETGAAKVARLFGISWSILPDFPKKEVDNEGYPTFTYRMRFQMDNQFIEADGSRSAKDEFFRGSQNSAKGQKSVDEIDLGDVQKAAFTNCLNNGIKRILPGLRNIDIAALEKAGLNGKQLKGYTFKTGSRGGNSGRAADSGLTCEQCGAPITQAEASYSQSHFNRKLCRICQKKPIPVAEPKFEELPPPDDADFGG